MVTSNHNKVCVSVSLMRFKFSCKETDGGIGFEAKGCGLGYRYDGRTLTLDVLHLCMRRPLLLLDLGPVFPRNPLLYAEFLEKAAQINALLYSSNQTLNLSETIHIEKLAPVVAQLSKTAELAHDVEMKNFARFAASLSAIHELHACRLEQQDRVNASEARYRLILKTPSGTEIRATGPTARASISKIAELMLRDVIALEFSAQSGQNAQNLIALSTRLSTIARLLDMNFDPYDKILISKKKEEKSRSGKSLY